MDNKYYVLVYEWEESGDYTLDVGAYVTKEAAQDNMEAIAEHLMDNKFTPEHVRDGHEEADVEIYDDAIYISSSWESVNVALEIYEVALLKAPKERRTIELRNK